MSSSQKKQSSAFLKRFVVMLVLVALSVPQIVCADSLLLLYKADTSNNVQLSQAIQQNSKRQPVVGFNENGDLTVTYGSVNMVLAYNPPEEPYKQQDSIRVAMAMNQAAPTISGVSIKLNFTF